MPKQRRVLQRSHLVTPPGSPAPTIWHMELKSTPHLPQGVSGKELQHKIKSCVVHKSSDSQTPGRRDHWILASSFNRSPPKLIITCSKTLPRFGHFVPPLPKQRARHTRSPPSLSLGVATDPSSDSQVCCWGTSIRKVAEEEAGAAPSFLMWETTEHWQWGAAKAEPGASRGVSCVLSPPAVRSPRWGPTVVPGPGISKPGLRPAGDFLSAQYLLICSFSA